MEINTDAIRRLRDYLLSHGKLRLDDDAATPDGGDGASSAGTDPWTGSAIARRVEPFAETMFLVMMADGEPDASERSALLGALNVLADGQVSPALFEAMFDRFTALATTEGVESRIAHLGARLSADQDERETAFTLAAAIALADDHVHAHENHTLSLIREYYGVSARRMAVLLETID